MIYSIKIILKIIKHFINILLKIFLKNKSNFERKLKTFFMSDYKYLLEEHKQKIIYKYEKY